MNAMDYEKAYNEALERARKIHDEIVNNEVIGFPGQMTEEQGNRPLPSDILEEAAEEYGRNIFINECMENGVCDDHDLSDAFVAGAEWHAEQNDKDLSEKIAAAYQLGLANKEEQMMKEAISCNVIWHDGPLLDYTQEQQDNALEKIGATIGDKVRIIIVKEESK